MNFTYDRTILLNNFQRVDTYKKGVINAIELHAAFALGSWPRLSIETSKMILAMFDANNSKAIPFETFESLWNFILDWLKLFKKNEKNESGYIDKNDAKLIFQEYGYKFSDECFSYIFMSLANRIGTPIKKNASVKPNDISFDDFICLVFRLNAITLSFNNLDHNRDALIQLNLSDFLTILFDIKSLCFLCARKI